LYIAFNFKKQEFIAIKKREDVMKKSVLVLTAVLIVVFSQVACAASRPDRLKKSFASAIENRLVSSFAHMKCASLRGISINALDEYFSEAFMYSDSWAEYIAELVAEESGYSVKFQFKELRDPGKGLIKIFTLSDGKSVRLIALSSSGDLSCSMNNTELSQFAELMLNQ
jgi:hypothetical protein